jgi:hypothetical protein
VIFFEIQSFRQRTLLGNLKVPLFQKSFRVPDRLCRSSQGLAVLAYQTFISSKKDSRSCGPLRTKMYSYETISNPSTRARCVTAFHCPKQFELGLKKWALQKGGRPLCACFESDHALPGKVRNIPDRIRTLFSKQLAISRREPSFSTNRMQVIYRTSSAHLCTRLDTDAEVHCFVQGKVGGRAKD